MTNIPRLEATVKLHHDATAPKDAKIASRVVAFAELKIADAFVIKNIRVMQTTDHERSIDGELFVCFPGERARGGGTRWNDVAHPTNREARDAAVHVILVAYSDAAGTS